MRRGGFGWNISKNCDRFKKEEKKKVNGATEDERGQKIERGGGETENKSCAHIARFAEDING